MALVAGLLFLSPVALAQRISIGVVGGGSFTHGFQDQTFLQPQPTLPGMPPPPIGVRFFSPAKDFLAGGMFELRFNPHWSLEVNGLFRQLNGKWAAVMPDGSLNSVSPHPVVTWQFPVLAKCRFRDWRANPFLEAGPSFRTAGNLNTSDPTHHGVTAGLGVEMKWRNVNIAPVVRYTRWARDRNSVNAQTAPDQLELLVAFSRAGDSNWRPLGRRVSLGVILGTSLTGDFATTSQQVSYLVPGSVRSVTEIGYSGPRDLIFGPTVEVQLPRRLSVQVDALHRPFAKAVDVVDADGTRRSGTGRWGEPYGVYRSATWQCPVLAKYRLAVRGVNPFIAAGPSFRLTQHWLTDASPYGVTAAAGLDRRFWNFRISPAVRFTHWNADRQPSFGGIVRNQTEFLVGIAF